MDSTDAREEWARRDGEFSPAYYAYRGPDGRSELVRRTLDRHLPRDAAVLEVGCSAGRHLAHLAEHGYTDLAGVDINPAAFEVMADQYPELAAGGSFHRGALGEVLPGFPDDRFDAVFSVETLQHLDPEAERVFEEVARVAGDLLVTVENERPADGGEVTLVDDDLPLYHRDWGRVFDGLGFEAVDVVPADRDVARTFRAG